MRKIKLNIQEKTNVFTPKVKQSEVKMLNDPPHDISKPASFPTSSPNILWARNLRSKKSILNLNMADTAEVVVLVVSVGLAYLPVAYL